MRKHSTAVRRTLLREIDDDVPQFVLFPPIGPEATVVEDLDPRGLVKFDFSK
jgi:hypothetical protein